MKGGLSIYNIMDKLCRDIKNILYIKIDDLNIKNSLKVKNNLKVLKFVYNIYKVANFHNEFIDDLYSVVNDDTKTFSQKLRLKKRDKNYGMLFIYKIIINSILKFDKNQKGLYLTDEEYENLEAYWIDYENNVLAYDHQTIPPIKNTLNEMKIEIDKSRFEIKEFFNILIKIYKKILLLYEHNKSTSNKLKDFLMLSMNRDDIEKYTKVLNNNCSESLTIVGKYSIYLAINLGDKDLPILFSYTNKNNPKRNRDILDSEESLVFNIPLFNCIENNEEILQNIKKYINNGVYIVYETLLSIKQKIDNLEQTLDFKVDDPYNIYKMYLNVFNNNLIQSIGGRKKRIIKSKKDIKQKSKKIST
jgi:hypothetical protein